MSTAIEANGKHVNRIAQIECRDDVADYDGMKPIELDDWIEWYVENEQSVQEMFRKRAAKGRRDTLGAMRSLYRSVNLKKYSERHMAFTAMLFWLSDKQFIGSRGMKKLVDMAGCELSQFARWSEVKPLQDAAPGDLDRWSSLEESIRSVCDMARKSESDLEKCMQIADAVKALLEK